jgi:hypothetical protein
MVRGRHERYKKSPNGAQRSEPPADGGIADRYSRHSHGKRENHA